MDAVAGAQASFPATSGVDPILNPFVRPEGIPQGTPTDLSSLFGMGTGGGLGPVAPVSSPALGAGLPSYDAGMALAPTMAPAMSPFAQPAAQPQGISGATTLADLVSRGLGGLGMPPQAAQVQSPQQPYGAPQMPQFAAQPFAQAMPQAPVAAPQMAPQAAFPQAPGIAQAPAPVVAPMPAPQATGMASLFAQPPAPPQVQAPQQPYAQAPIPAPIPPAPAPAYQPSAPAQQQYAPQAPAPAPAPAAPAPAPVAQAPARPAAPAPAPVAPAPARRGAPLETDPNAVNPAEDYPEALAARRANRRADGDTGNDPGRPYQPAPYERPDEPAPIEQPQEQPAEAPVEPELEPAMSGSPLQNAQPTESAFSNGELMIAGRDGRRFSRSIGDNAGGKGVPTNLLSRVGLTRAILSQFVDRSVVGTMTVPDRPMDNADDVAALAYEYLRKQPQENFMAVILDGQGRPIQILRHQLGNISSTGFMPHVIAGVAASTRGARTVYMVHNHPSTTTRFSAADITAAQSLSKTIESIGLRFGGSLVVTDGDAHEGNMTPKYIFHPGGELVEHTPAARSENFEGDKQTDPRAIHPVIVFDDRPEAETTANIQVVERLFEVRKNALFPRIADGKDAVEQIPPLLTNKPGVALLDKAGRLVGVVQMSIGEMRNVSSSGSIIYPQQGQNRDYISNEDERAPGGIDNRAYKRKDGLPKDAQAGAWNNPLAMLMAALERSNAESVIISIGGENVGTSGRDVRSEAVNNLQKALMRTAGRKVEILDVINNSKTLTDLVIKDTFYHGSFSTRPDEKGARLSTGRRTGFNEPGAGYGNQQSGADPMLDDVRSRINARFSDQMSNLEADEVSRIMREAEQASANIRKTLDEKGNNEQYDDLYAQIYSIESDVVEKLLTQNRGRKILDQEIGGGYFSEPDQAPIERKAPKSLGDVVSQGMGQGNLDQIMKGLPKMPDALNENDGEYRGYTSETLSDWWYNVCTEKERAEFKAIFANKEHIENIERIAGGKLDPDDETQVNANSIIALRDWLKSGGQRQGFNEPAQDDTNAGADSGLDNAQPAEPIIKKTRKPRAKKVAGAPGVNVSAFPRLDATPGVFGRLSGDQMKQFGLSDAMLDQFVEHSTYGQIPSGVQTVKTADDAAHIVAGLRKRPQETVVLLITDKAGKPLQIATHTLSGPTSCGFNPGILIGTAASTPGAANLWFIHNHPSQKGSLSPADISAGNSIENLCKAANIRYMGTMAVAGNNYAVMDNNGSIMGNQKIKPLPRKYSVPLTERIFSYRVGQSGIQYTDPGVVGPELRRIFGDNQPGIVLADNSNRPVAAIPFDADVMQAMKAILPGDNPNKQTGFGKYVAGIDRSGAVNMFIYTASLDMPQAIKVIENMSRLANATKITPLDATNASEVTLSRHIIGYDSSFREPGSDYNAGEDAAEAPRSLGDVVKQGLAGPKKKNDEAVAEDGAGYGEYEADLVDNYKSIIAAAKRGNMDDDAGLGDLTEAELKELAMHVSAASANAREDAGDNREDWTDDQSDEINTIEMDAQEQWLRDRQDTQGMNEPGAAYDDGENQAVPGGGRQAWIKKQAELRAKNELPGAKRIQWWTDIGHSPGKRDKSWLWAYDKKGKLQVIGARDLQKKMMKEYDLRGANPTHLDWAELPGSDPTLLGGPAHGRIEVSGDVVRVSLVGRINDDTFRQQVKQELAEYIGVEVDRVKGYDFTDMAAVGGMPEVFEPGAGNGDRQNLSVERAFPQGKQSILFSDAATKLIGSNYSVHIEHGRNLMYPVYAPSMSLRDQKGNYIASASISFKKKYIGEGKREKVELVSSPARKKQGFPDAGFTALIEASDRLPNFSANPDDGEPALIGVRPQGIDRSIHDEAMVGFFREIIERLRQVGVTRIKFDMLGHGRLPLATEDALSGKEVKPSGNAWAAFQVAMEKSHPDAEKYFDENWGEAIYALDPNKAFEPGAGYGQRRRLSSSSQPGRMDKVKARAEAERMFGADVIAGLVDSGVLTFGNSAMDADPTLTAMEAAEMDNAGGWAHYGKAYIIAPKIGSAEDLRAVILHEIGQHLGFGKSDQVVNDFFNDTIKAYQEGNAVAGRAVHMAAWAMLNDGRYSDAVVRLGERFQRFVGMDFESFSEGETAISPEDMDALLDVIFDPVNSGNEIDEYERREFAGVLMEEVGAYIENALSSATEAELARPLWKRFCSAVNMVIYKMTNGRVKLGSFTPQDIRDMHIGALRAQARAGKANDGTTPIRARFSVNPQEAQRTKDVPMAENLKKAEDFPSSNPSVTDEQRLALIRAARVLSPSPEGVGRAVGFKNKLNFEIMGVESDTRPILAEGTSPESVFSTSSATHEGIPIVSTRGWQGTGIQEKMAAGGKGVEPGSGVGMEESGNGMLHHLKHVNSLTERFTAIVHGWADVALKKNESAAAYITGQSEAFRDQLKALRDDPIAALETIRDHIAANATHKIELFANEQDRQDGKASKVTLIVANEGLQLVLERRKMEDGTDVWATRTMMAIKSSDSKPGMSAKQIKETKPEQFIEIAARFGENPNKIGPDVVNGGVTPIGKRRMSVAMPPPPNYPAPIQPSGAAPVNPELSTAQKAWDFVTMRYFSGISSKAHQNARRFEGASIQAVADMIHNRPGNQGSAAPRSIPTSIMTARAKYTNRFRDIMEPMRDHLSAMTTASREQFYTDLTDMITGRRQLATGFVGKMAKDLKQLLADLHDYRVQAGEDLGEIQDYFPVVYNSDLITKNRTNFLVDAERAYKIELSKTLSGPELDSTAAASALALYNTHVRGMGAVEFGSLFNKTAPGGRENSSQERVFGRQAQNIMRRWQSNDPFLVITRYIGGATKSAELARKFGADGSGWNKYAVGMEAEGVPHEVINEMHELVCQAAGVGTAGLGSKGQAFMDSVALYTAATSLGKSFMSNLFEPISMGVRTGSPLYALRAYAETWTRSVNEFIKDKPIVKMLSNESFWQQYGEHIGTIQNSMEDAWMTTHSMELGMDNQNPRMRWLTNRIYKANLMDATETAKQQASHALGHSYIGDLCAMISGDHWMNTFGMDASRSATRDLVELGVPEAEHQAFISWMKALKATPAANRFAVMTDGSPMSKLYEEAQVRFTNQTAVRANRAHRPVFQDNLMGKMFLQLQSFSYSYAAEANSRIYDNAKQLISGGDYTLADRLRLVAPAMMLPLAIAAFGAMFKLRRELYPTEASMKRDDDPWWAQFLDAASYAGVFGPKVEQSMKFVMRDQPPGGIVGQHAIGAARAVKGYATAQIGPEEKRDKAMASANKAAVKAAIPPVKGAIVTGAAALSPGLGTVANMAMNDTTLSNMAIDATKPEETDKKREPQNPYKYRNPYRK